ncbi:MAG: hypothetical protein V1685_04470, partial [Parcubacteria group bacterium]
HHSHPGSPAIERRKPMTLDEIAESIDKKVADLQVWRDDLDLQIAEGFPPIVLPPEGLDIYPMLQVLIREIKELKEK